MIAVIFINLLLNKTVVTSLLAQHEVQPASVLTDLLLQSEHGDVKNSRSEAIIQQIIIYLTTCDSIIIVSHRIQFCKKHKLSRNVHFSCSSQVTAGALHPSAFRRCVCTEQTYWTLTGTNGVEISFLVGNYRWGHSNFYPWPSSIYLVVGEKRASVRIIVSVRT